MDLIEGVVPEPAGQVAQDGEMLGPFDHHGRVRTVRRYGPTLAPSAGNHRQIGQRERMRRPVASR